MPRLLNTTAARKLAGELPIHLGSTGIEALNQRIEQIIRNAAEKARRDGRKTILERDVRHDPDLFG